jgi:hypothetical protein
LDLGVVVDSDEGWGDKVGGLGGDGGKEERYEGAREYEHGCEYYGLREIAGKGYICDFLCTRGQRRIVVV